MSAFLVLVAPYNVELAMSDQPIVYSADILAIEHAIAGLLHHHIYLSHVPSKLGYFELRLTTQLANEDLVESA